MKLNPKALGLAAGILCGVSVCLATLFVILRGGGDHLKLLQQFYLGYSVSYVGAIVGLIYGFIDGFIGGWLLAWLYNRLDSSASPT